MRVQVQLIRRLEERDGSWDGLLILDFCMADL